MPTPVPPSVYPGAEDTQLGTTAADYHTGAGGGLSADGARNWPALVGSAVRKLEQRLGFSTDTAADTTITGRVIALEGGGGQSRTEAMGALPALCGRVLTYPDAVTTSHTYGASVASGKLRFTAGSGTTDGNLRCVYGHVPSGNLGDSEVRSTWNATSGTRDGVARFQFGHVHRMRVDRVVLDTGLATAVTSTTLSDSTKTWSTSPKQFAGVMQGGREVFVKITAGTGSTFGQIRKVITNTATQVTVDSAWATNPDTTSRYEIYAYAVNTITVMNSIVFGIHAFIQPGGWDNGTFGPSGLNAADLTGYLGGLGSLSALPWKMKSRIIGNTLDAVLWKAVDSEPAYGTSGKSGSWTLPTGFGDSPGMSGLYVGHMIDTTPDWMEYDDLTITRL